MARAKTIYKHYVGQLIKCLPMNDAHFTAELFGHGLLPGNTCDEIKASLTQADKTSYFLNNVVKPALDIDDISYFNILLFVMKHCGYVHVENLAGKIKSEINNGSNIIRGSYLCAHM